MAPPWMTAVIANGFAVCILLVLIVDFSVQHHRYLLRAQRLFLEMLALNIIILALDAGTYLLNGQTFPGARTLNYCVTTAFYVLNPLMSVLFALYCDVKLKAPWKIRRKRQRLYWLPFLLNLPLAVLSVPFSLMFRIEQDNTYTRGPLLAVSFALSFALLALSIVHVAVYLKNVKKKKETDTFTSSLQSTIPLLVFPIVPLVGGVLQSFWFHTVTIVWISTVIGLLLVYIAAQNEEIYTDALTGLYNRKKTDNFIRNLPMNGAEEHVCLAVLDVDNFKRINDCHGHLTGDMALKVIANTLQSVCDRETFLGRYGGDEFVMITRRGGQEKLQGILDRTEAVLNQYCREKGLEYSLSISAGIAEESEQLHTIDQIFAAADARLYQNKTRLMRRASDPKNEEAPKKE